MALHPDLKKLHKAVRRLIDAEVSDAWKGAGDPADIPAIEKELKDAKTAYRDAMADVGDTIEAYRGGTPRSNMG